MREYNLESRYSNQKSFYGKAVVRVYENGDKDLISYSTLVAKIRDNGYTAIVEDTYSKTTLIHIKEFLQQECFEATSKAQILKDYAPKGDK